jgi:hypothetical protein
MTIFEGYKNLFDFFKVPNNPQKHWINTSGWSMAEAMHEFVIWATCLTMQKAWFTFVSCDKVTTIDNQSWISIHVYVMERCKRLPILLALQ